jgi:hypothetical protein
MSIQNRIERLERKGAWGKCRECRGRPDLVEIIEREGDKA